MPQGKNKKKKGGRSPKKKSPRKSPKNKHKHQNRSSQNGNKSQSNGSQSPQKNLHNEFQNGANNGIESANKNGQEQQLNNEPKSEAMILKDKGNVEFQNQHYKKAIDFYTQAIELENDNHTFYSNRSAAYKSFGKFDEALDDANKCIQLKPDWAKGYVRKGTVYIAQSKLGQAEEVYKQGLKVCTEKAPLKVSSSLFLIFFFLLFIIYSMRFCAFFFVYFVVVMVIESDE